MNWALRSGSGITSTGWVSYNTIIDMKTFTLTMFLASLFLFSCSPKNTISENKEETFFYPTYEVLDVDLRMDTLWSLPIDLMGNNNEECTIISHLFPDNIPLAISKAKMHDIENMIDFKRFIFSMRKVEDCDFTDKITLFKLKHKNIDISIFSGIEFFFQKQDDEFIRFERHRIYDNAHCLLIANEKIGILPNCDYCFLPVVEEVWDEDGVWIVQPPLWNSEINISNKNNFIVSKDYDSLKIDNRLDSVLTEFIHLEKEIPHKYEIYIGDRTQNNNWSNNEFTQSIILSATPINELNDSLEKNNSLFYFKSNGHPVYIRSFLESFLKTDNKKLPEEKNITFEKSNIDSVERKVWILSLSISYMKILKDGWLPGEEITKEQWDQLNNLDWQYYPRKWVDVKIEK